VGDARRPCFAGLHHGHDDGENSLADLLCTKDGGSWGWGEAAVAEHWLEVLCSILSIGKQTKKKDSGCFMWSPLCWHVLPVLKGNDLHGHQLCPVRCRSHFDHYRGVNRGLENDRERTDAHSSCHEGKKSFQQESWILMGSWMTENGSSPWERRKGSCGPISDTAVVLSKPLLRHSLCLQITPNLNMLSQVWWCTPVVQLLGRLRQEHRSLRPAWATE
jgi:hypothetical protein